MRNTLRLLPFLFLPLFSAIVLAASPATNAGAKEKKPDPTKIRWVVKNGELWEAGTMKKLWPREEPPPAFFWKTLFR